VLKATRNTPVEKKTPGSKHPPSFVNNPQKRLVKGFDGCYILVIDPQIAAGSFDGGFMVRKPAFKKPGRDGCIKKQLLVSFQIAEFKRRGIIKMLLHGVSDPKDNNVLFFEPQMP